MLVLILLMLKKVQPARREGKPEAAQPLKLKHAGLPLARQ